MVEVDEDTFGELVEAALASIPDQLRRMMRNVVVAVEDIGVSPNLLGLYQGIPLTSRTSSYVGALPDQITIYRLPICWHCHSAEDVVRQVRVTVVHEVAHHFGIDDDRLHELGWA
jgi:predicted Zn-dependent protease with MMP-like domain